MAEVKVFSWFLAVGYFFLRVAWLTVIFLWRVLVGVSVTAFALVRALWFNKIIAGILIGLFAIGLPMQLFQEEIMTGLDEVYECGVYPAVQIGSSILNKFLNVPYTFIAERWNELILLIFDALDNLFGDIRTLVRIGKVVSVQSGFGAVTAMIFEDELGSFADFWVDLWKALGEYLGGWGEFFGDLWEWLTDVVLAWFVNVDMFSRDCSLCSADLVPECLIRKPFLPGQAAADCDQCVELWADAWGIFGSLADAALGNFIDKLGGETSFRRIGRAWGCVVRSLFHYPLMIVAGIIETGIPGCLGDADDIFNIADSNSLLFRWFLAGDDPISYDCSDPNFSQICCGRPSGCNFPHTGGTDLPIGIFPCFGELFRALTNNAIDDWLSLVLALLLKPIDDVIRTVERTIECAETPGYQDCLENYPAVNAANPGFCSYDTTDLSILTPNGGLHECFRLVYDCLNFETEVRAPLIVFLVGPGSILEFLLDDFWKFSVDFAVCPFADLFSVTCDILGIVTFDDFVKWLECIEITNPIFGPIFGPLAEILSAINTLITGITEDINEVKGDIDDILAIFSCVGDCGLGEIIDGSIVECFTGGEGCDEPMSDNVMDYLSKRKAALDTNPETLERWREMLMNRARVPPSSFCGTVLYDTLPDNAAARGWGDYVTYMSCFSVYGLRLGYTQACQNLSSVPYERSGSGVWQALTEARAIRRNCSVEGRARLGDRRGNATRLGSSFVSSPKMSFTNFTVWTNKINVTEWKFMPGFVYPVWESIKKTQVFGRTSEFYESYRVKLRAYDSEPEDSALRPLIEAELNRTYIDFVNDILSFYRTRKWRNETLLLNHTGEDEIGGAVAQYVGAGGKVYQDATLESLHALPDRMWKKMEELRIVEPSDPVADRMSLRVNVTAKTIETWNAVNDATHLEFRPWFQAIAGTIHALRRRDGLAVMKMLRGRTKYIASRAEFVTPAKFAAEAPSSFTPEGQMTPTLLGALTGTNTWNSRLPRKYAPFPALPLALHGEAADAKQPRWQDDAYAHLAEMHIYYNAKRAEKAKKKQAAIGDFDGNQILYDVLDAFLGLFPSVTGRPFNDLVDGTIDFWSTFDLKNWTEEVFEKTVIDFFTCSIPENFDGTSLYSPWCIFLYREDAMALFTPVTGTEGQFPPQIPWPVELIADPCVSVYTGDPDLFFFEFSNNCLLEDGNREESTACTSGCAGDVTLRARDFIQSQDIIEYSVNQTGGGPTCAITNMMVFVPDCATVDNVTSDGDCVTGFDANVAVSNDTCVPGIPTGLLNTNIMRVDLSFPIGGACVFRVAFSEKVEFAPGDSLVALTAQGEGLCTNCSLTLPTTTCLSSDAPPVDLFPPQKRPFCGTSGCDFCKREYDSCADAGFGDWLDSAFYVLGILPRVLDELLFGGIEAKLLEFWFGPAIVMASLIVVFPLFFVMCCGVIVLPVVIGFGHLLTWTLFILFGGLLPYPLLFFAVALYAQTRNPKWWELLIWGLVLTVSIGIPFAARVAMVLLIIASRVPALKKVFKPVFVIIYLTWAIWILSIVFVFPKFTEFVSINQVISDILLWIDDSMILFFIDFSPLRARVDKYIFPPGSAVPILFDFCFWWNWANLALVTLVFLFVWYPLLLIFRVVWAPILFILGAIWLALDMRTKVLLIPVRQKAEDVQKSAKRNKDRISSMRKRTKDAFESLRTRLVRGFLGEPEPSSVVVANGHGDTRLTLGAIRGPDETTDQFRKRRRREADGDNNNQNASDDDEGEREDDSGPDTLVVETTIVLEPQPVHVEGPRRRRRHATRLTLNGANPHDLVNKDD